MFKKTFRFLIFKIDFLKLTTQIKTKKPVQQQDDLEMLPTGFTPVKPDKNQLPRPDLFDDSIKTPKKMHWLERWDFYKKIIYFYRFGEQSRRNKVRRRLFCNTSSSDEFWWNHRSNFTRYSSIVTFFCKYNKWFCTKSYLLQF